MQQATSAVQSSSTTSPTSGASSPNGMPPGSTAAAATVAAPPSSGVSPAASGATGTATTNKTHVNGGRFDFDDGGTYCGGWEDGKAHGHGVCTGPKGQGAYSGSWHYGFEVSGIYTWPSGSAFEGQWQNGKRHGLGVESRGRWLYRGEWTQGFKGRYGVRQSSTSNAKYEGTWANGLQDGYGSETYADGGTYQGQWLRGMRHGYGVRASAPFGLASHYRPNKALRASLTSLRSNEGGGGAGGAVPVPDPAERRDRRVDDSRGGFVLKARSDDPPVRRNSLVEKSSNIKKSLLSGLKIRKQRSTGDLEKRGAGTGSIRSTGSSASWMSNESSQSVMTNASLHTDSNASFVVEDEQMDASVTETYMGEWKNDKRTGFGISERSDGLRYEGEWFANKKYGYGVTTFRDGSKEEGKYKNNVLITSQKKKHLFLIRSAKFRERIDAAVNAAQRASKIALQKADIAISRTATARGKAELADIAADHAKEDSDIAQVTAKQFAPDFKQPGLERLRQREPRKFIPPPEDTLPGKSILTQKDASKQAPANPSLQQTNNTFNSSIKQPSIESYPNSQNLPNSYTTPISNYTSSSPSSQPNQHNYPQSNFNQQSQLNSPQSYNQIPQGSNQQPQYNQQQTQQQAPQSSYNQQQTLYQQQPTSYPSQYSQQINSYSNQQNYAAQNTYQDFKPEMNQIDQNRIPNMPNSLTQSPPIDSQNQMAQSGYNQQPSVRRNSRQPGMRPSLEGIHSQSSIDRFDHYNRPPSRDSSVDRYARATGRLGSRQPSVDKTLAPAPDVPDRSQRAPSIQRAGTPLSTTGNGSVMSGMGAAMPQNNSKVYNVQTAIPAPANPPFEDILLRNRNLGQDIIPSPGQPKRTESLYINPGRQGGGGGGGAVGGAMPKIAPVPQPLQRKKSLPDVQVLPRATTAMSREEVSALGSARREEVRRQVEESDRLRANPLLYLVSPQVKDWFSRQQLMLLVLFINISLAIMFFKLLT